ncbi:MAG: DUF4835 family protein, partial [Odoribacter sp.]
MNLDDLVVMKIGIKLLLIFLFIGGSISISEAQELKCTVSIFSQKIQGTDRELFSNMQRDLYEFLNNKRWSGNVFAYDERI